MKIQFRFYSLLLVSCILAVTACEPKEDDFLIKDKEVHPQEIGEQIEAQFGPGCTGLQYAIVLKGQIADEGAVGKAILAQDGTESDYNTTYRKSVHSMSKTITAAAMVKALNANNISLDSSIEPYLPERWELPAAVSDITFRQLLTHKSGFRGTHDSYAAMRDYIEAGVFDTKDVSVSVGYANINFSLMRILIPMVNPIVRDALNETLATDGEDTYALMVAQGYIAYVRNTVLIPSGIDEEVGPYIWDTDEAAATRNYNFANPSMNGYTHSDGTLLTGAGGWYMNAHDYAAFLTYLLHDELDGIDSQVMLDGNLGLFANSYGAVDFFEHNGAFTDGDGRGGRAQWIHIPDTDLTMVVQINSANNTFSLSELRNGMIDAYLDSIY